MKRAVVGSHVFLTCSSLCAFTVTRNSRPFTHARIGLNVCKFFCVQHFMCQGIPGIYALHGKVFSVARKVLSAHSHICSA